MLQVSMMSSTTSSTSTRCSRIKKEEDSYRDPCSPPSSGAYSPSTTLTPATSHDYCDSGYVEVRSRSPSSPDRQYCSSTTQSLGELMIGHIDVSTYLTLAWLEKQSKLNRVLKLRLLAESENCPTRALTV
ncbi:hypothetical protein J6590_049178 [Homalodisca vitripennis]|nr:hypothetical protein J6590_049178 [Homalodisca vitripennis]